MKIGFDAKRAFNNQTGLGNYSRFVIEGMLQHFPNDTFYLFTPKIKPEFSGLFSAYKNAIVITPQQIWGKTFQALWRSTAITGLLNKLGVDVYHGLSNELPTNINKFKGKKLVTIHDLIFLRYPQYYKPIDRKIYQTKFKQACLDADVIVAASKQTAADVQTYYQQPAAKLAVVYQNCAPQFSEQRSKETLLQQAAKYQLPQHFILCVGTIEERKNQLAVLKAFHQSGLNTALVFVGKQTPYANKLHNYVNEYQLQQQVMFIEGASFSDFPAFYQLAKVVVYASEFEGFGIPVLEALRSGATAVVAKTSSLVEVGGEAVYYVEANDETAFANALLQAFQQPIDKEKIEQQLHHFETPLLMQQLRALYQQG